MKKIINLVVIVNILIGSAMAEVVYLRDGQVVKGDIISQDSSIMKIKTEYGNISLPKGNVEKIAFEDVVEVNRSNISDPDYEEYLFHKKIKDRRYKKRASSVVSIGSGVGLPYGLLGTSFEALLGGHFALGAGFDNSGTGMKSFNAKIYLGPKGSAFRWRVGFLFGDTHATTFGGSNENSILTQGKYIFTGFQWKMATWLSLNLDIGYVMHNEHSIRYEYARWYGTSYYRTMDFYDGFAPALGLVVHL